MSRPGAEGGDRLHQRRQDGGGGELHALARRRTGSGNCPSAGATRGGHDAGTEGRRNAARPAATTCAWKSPARTPSRTPCPGRAGLKTSQPKGSGAGCKQDAATEVQEGDLGPNLNMTLENVSPRSGHGGGGAGAAGGLDRAGGHEAAQAVHASMQEDGSLRPLVSSRSRSAAAGSWCCSGAPRTGEHPGPLDLVAPACPASTAAPPAAATCLQRDHKH